MSTGAASGVPAVPATYSTLMQANHLLGGAAVLGCVGTVLQAQKYKPGKDKGDLMFLHKSFGLLSFLLLGPRLAARALQTLPSAPPSVGIPLEKALAAVTHYGLYGGLLLMPATGIVMGAYGGRGLPFFTTTYFPPVEKDGKLAGQAFKIHSQFGYWWKFLIPAHVGAAAVHSAAGASIMPRMFSVVGLKP